MAAGTRLDIWNRALRRIGSDPIESEGEDRPEAADLRLHFDDILREVLEARRWPWAMRQRPITKVDSQVQIWAGDGVNVVFDVPFAMLDPGQLEVAHVVGGVATVLTPTTQYSVAFPPAPPPYARVTLIGIVPAVGQSIRLTVTTSRVGWEHLFALPADCVTPHALLGEDQRYELLPTRERTPWDKLINDAGTGHLLACNLDEGDFEVLEYVAFITHVPAFSAHFQEALIRRCAAELAFGPKKDANLGGKWLDAYRVALGQAFATAANGREVGPPPPSPSAQARGLRTDTRTRWPRG